MLGGSLNVAPQNGTEEILTIALDHQENLVIGGHFGSSINFLTAASNIYISQTPSYYYGVLYEPIYEKSFCAKLNKNTLLAIWAKDFFKGDIFDIEIKSDNTIIALFNNIITYTGYSGTNSYFTSLRALDINGNFLNLNYYIFDSDFENIEIDYLDNIYLQGIFYFSTDFDPSLNNYSMSSVNGNKFIVKMDGNFNFIWASQFNGNNPEIETDEDENIYVSFITNNNLFLNKYCINGTLIYSNFISYLNSYSANSSKFSIGIQNQILLNNGMYYNQCNISNNCQNQLYLTNQLMQNTYSADDKLFSNGIVDINSGGTVNFYVGDDFIELQNNFEADGTVNFNSKIIDCNLAD